MDALEARIEKKKGEIRSMQKRLKKKKNELRELEWKQEREKEKKQAEFNAKVVEEMEQRFGKFTEESLEEFLKNLDTGPFIADKNKPDSYSGSMNGL